MKKRPKKQIEFINACRYLLGLQFDSAFKILDYAIYVKWAKNRCIRNYCKCLKKVKSIKKIRKMTKKTPMMRHE